MEQPLSNTFKSNFPIEKLRSKLNDIWNLIEYIDDFGHVGCYEMSPEEIQLRSRNVLVHISQAELSIDLIADALKESYEY